MVRHCVRSLGELAVGSVSPNGSFSVLSYETNDHRHMPYPSPTAIKYGPPGITCQECSPSICESHRTNSLVPFEHPALPTKKISYARLLISLFSTRFSLSRTLAPCVKVRIPHVPASSWGTHREVRHARSFNRFMSPSQSPPLTIDPRLGEHRDKPLTF